MPSRMPECWIKPYKVPLRVSFLLRHPESAKRSLCQLFFICHIWASVGNKTTLQSKKATMNEQFVDLQSQNLDKETNFLFFFSVTFEIKQ